MNTNPDHWNDYPTTSWGGNFQKTKVELTIARFGMCSA